MNKLLQSIKNRTKQLESKTPETITIKLIYDDGRYAILQSSCEIKRYTKEGKIIK